MLYRLGKSEWNKEKKYFFSFVLCVLLIAESLGQNPQKIPIDGNRWYQLTNAERGLQKLFDNDLFTSLEPQFGLIISPYESYYPLLKGEKISIFKHNFDSK